MKITLLQMDIAWGKIADNCAHADALIDRHPGSDLYVLPEMFSTGFCTRPEGMAEPAGGPALQWMMRKAESIGAAIAGSIAVCENGHYYNRFYFAEPDGKVSAYDKRHLFTYGGEHEHYTAGNRRVVVTFRGVRILLETCYDLRFPVWARNRDDYDLILYVASWPTPRIAAWSVLLQARAIENQCFVAGVNRVGADEHCTYNGASALIDAYGKTLAAADNGLETALTHELDLERLHAFRKKFPVLQDRDR